MMQNVSRYFSYLPALLIFFLKKKNNLPIPLRDTGGYITGGYYALPGTLR